MAGQGNGKQPRVLADPHAELPVKNYKYVKNCVELYLSQRGIEEIAHFDAFVNLEVLWLNHNRIEKLDGLNQCVRIKELYAQDNRIRSLEGSSLAHFKFLHTLRLNDNKLRDFSSTLAVLTKLHHLEDLDLHGNPLQEEDYYRLRVVRAVPSLLVLDRHLVTDEERAKAARLRGDEPLVVARANDRKTRSLQRDSSQQSMSGTVRMLFKEVEKVEREREAARKEALAQELRRMDQQQQQLTRQSTRGSSRSGGLPTTAAGLDTWEMAALEKRFRSLEDKPKGGVALDRLPTLIAYLADCGFAVVTCNGTSLTQDDVGEHPQTHSVDALSKVFPSTTTVTWPLFQQSLETRQLLCQFLPATSLRHRADAYFAQAAALQRRLSAVSVDDAARTAMLRECHDAAQRGYHLAALADGGKSSTEKGPTKKQPRKHHVLSPLRTRCYVTAFAREETASPAFHTLDDQRARVSGELSTKYRFHQKDFQKYMMKQAPPTTTVVRRHLHL